MATTRAVGHGPWWLIGSPRGTVIWYIKRVKGCVGKERRLEEMVSALENQKDTNKAGGDEAAAGLSPELREELRLARNCFAQIERLTQLMSGYPPGHPMVEEGVERLNEAFYAFFELTDRLTVQVHPHWMDLYGTGEAVWETAEPKDYCFNLSRDGVYLLHILAGVTEAELQVFVEVLNELVDQQSLERDAVTMLFDAEFRYISWDAIDESLAALAGLDSDLKNRDTREEQEMIEELFDEAFDDRDVSADDGGMFNEEEFEVRLQSRREQQLKLEVGSRHFLRLSEASRQRLKELKKGFTEHAELEHRQGEMLSAVLGAKPRSRLRKDAVAQIGQVMGQLLETEEPWEALAFLKLIHRWRDKFQPQVAGELKQVVRRAFSEERIRKMAKKVAKQDKKGRRAILQMFDALGLQQANAPVAELLAWELDDGARSDVLAFIRKQANRDLGFLEEAIDGVPEDRLEALIDIACAAMPRTRPILIKQLSRALDPMLKVKVLGALDGTWEDSTDIRDYLVPLVRSGHTELRLTAARSLGRAAPQHVVRVMGPMLTPSLAKRPEQEVQELIHIFVTRGGPKAMEKLEELVRRKGLVSDEEKELAVTVVQAMIKTPTDEVMELLETVAGDWLVAGRIRSVCQEIVDLVKED